MKKILLLLICSLWLPISHAESPTTIKEAKDTQTKWNGSVLSSATIKKIQQNKYAYRHCIFQEAQKQSYQKLESRVATDAVMKHCETHLNRIRTTFITSGVPHVIADRFLKKSRTDMTRKILKSLMFSEAARHAGAI